MGRVFHSYYTRPKPNGKGRERVTSRRWCAEWTAVDGSTKRKTIGLDKRAAEIYLARRVEEVERERAGLGAPVDSSPARMPILELLDDYISELASRETGEKYRDQVRQQVGDCAAWCRWQTWPDVREDAVKKFLVSLRARGDGPSTTNGYLRSLKGFTGWVADSLNVAAPLRKIRASNVALDRRRSKAILTDSELARLIEAAERAKPTRNQTVPPRDRAMIYRVAAYTGLRVMELASLTPESFDLASKPARVSPHARDQKAKRPDVIPLPAVLVSTLRPWLKRKPPGERLWPGTWAGGKRQRDWLAADLRRAGIGLAPDGKPYHFHSLRRLFVTALIRSGADVDEVRRLARHKSVATTLESYASTDLDTLGKAVDRLGK